MRTFCCCLPVRLGVFILTILGLAGGLILSVVGWEQVTHIRRNPLSTENSIALVLHSIMFTLLALISLLGFIGAIIKQRSLVSTFGMMLLVHLLVNVGIGIYAIYSMFRNNSKEIISACLDGQTDKESLEVCKSSAKVVQGIIITIYILVWLLQLFGFIIVIRYCHQLDDEEDELAKTKPGAVIGKPLTTYDSFGLGGSGLPYQNGIPVGPSRGHRSEV
ncbi:hypothetical protein AMATHDRAFT_142119 [Amanita thiersii Skay4041]|uniref:MARVEL domain-containing protein n=1 Tax=Amanita thiersii Skay4041 TaxID=703135 RepID=A0A2A9NVG0_9AGAR|nr:hypothetical protein AMATHDRAFT_142119 [Amanita thiersii Skay4041]